MTTSVPESSRPDDGALVDAARRGDRAALEALLVRHQDRIYRFGLKMCHDPHEAEDVVQDTMMAMARSIGDFRGASSLTTWLYAIARSFCLKRRRKSKFAPAREESLDGAVNQDGDRFRDMRPAPDELAMAHETRRALEGAIRALDPGQRDVLLLRDVEGLTAPEVAEVLGIGVPAVKSRLHRARVAVRNRVAPLLQPAAPALSPAPLAACPDVVSALTRHLEGDLSRAQCAEMERHLGDCGQCRAACESLKQTLALCRSGDSPVVPEAVRQRLRVQIAELSH